MASKEQITSSPLVRRLVRRVTKLVAGSEDVIASDLGLPSNLNFEKTSAADGKFGASRARQAQSLARVLADEIDRHRIFRYRDYREMEDDVPELECSLDVLVDFTFGGKQDNGDDEEAVQIEFGTNASPELKAVVHQAAADTGLQQMLPQVFREGNHLGDSFTELVFVGGRTGRLVWQKGLLPDNVSVVWDEWGRLRCYAVREGEGAVVSTLGTTNVRALAPWQVIHYCPSRRRNHKYGRSNWAGGGRRLWSAEKSASDVTTILAMLRAVARKSVAYPVPAGIDEDQAQGYIDKLRGEGFRESFFDSDGKLRRRIATLLELDDIVYPYRSGTNPPSFHNEQSADLRQMVDLIQFYQERYFIVSGVPAAFCGLERNINARSTLEVQGLQFMKTIKKHQREVAQIALTLLWRAALAANIRPKKGDIIIRMPRSSVFDDKLRAEIDLLRARTAKLLKTDVGLDAEFVVRKVLKVPEEDADALLTRLEDLGDAEVPMPTSHTGGRPEAAAVESAIQALPGIAGHLAVLSEAARELAQDVTADQPAEAA